MADTDVAIVVSDDEDSDINVSNHASEVRAMFDTISQSVAVDEKIRPDLYTVYNDDTQFSSVDDYLNTIKGGAPDELLESYDAVLALTNYSPKTPAYAGDIREAKFWK